MLIRTLEELRLYNTSHALDDLEPLMGIIDNVEKDILVDKLGKPLYTALCSHYKNVNTSAFVRAVLDDSLDNDMDVLLRLSQAVVANEVINLPRTMPSHQGMLWRLRARNSISLPI